MTDRECPCPTCIANREDYEAARAEVLRLTARKERPMTKDELNERLALTFEPRPVEPPTYNSPHPLVGEPCTPAGAWIFHQNHEIKKESDSVLTYYEPTWKPADFTSPYWFHRLIVEHRLVLDSRVPGELAQVYWYGAPLEDVVHHEDVAMAVAQAALKIREAK